MIAAQQTDVPSWVFDAHLPDRLIRALVAAVRLGADGGVWHANTDAARTLGVTDRTLRTYCNALVRAGAIARVGRARYRISTPGKTEGAGFSSGAP